MIPGLLRQRSGDHLDGLTVAVAVGSKSDRLNAPAQNAMVTVINRENAVAGQTAGPAWPFDMVVIELSSQESPCAAVQSPRRRPPTDRADRGPDWHASPRMGWDGFVGRSSGSTKASASAGSSPTIATAGLFRIRQRHADLHLQAPARVLRTASMPRSRYHVVEAPPTT